MKLSTVAQMREIDKLTIEKFNIPGIILMENAGKSVADIISAKMNNEKVLVICGKGNNGGDGSVVARHLFCMGKNVALSYICGTDSLTGDAKTVYEMAKSIGVAIKRWDISLINDFDIIVDAILGIGAKGAPSDEIAGIIKEINKSGKVVYSVDVPSGGNCDTGQVLGECVKANCTVTFGLCKIGMVCYPLKSFVGELIISGIGFSPQAIEKQKIKANTIEKINLPPVSADNHKGSAGKVFVLAGSKGFTGAAYLNSMAALKSGCGLVTLGIPSSLNTVMEQKLTEVITLPFDDNDGVLSKSATDSIKIASKSYNAIICGSGLSKNDDIFDIITSLVKSSEKPMVIDADGLNVLSKNPEALKNKNCDIVITPHLGEMARLIDKPIDYVAGNTVEVAKSFAKVYNVTVVLKSAHTVIANPMEEVYINTIGNGGMATAGSGDVLAGIIGSFIAQGINTFESSVFGVQVHAEAGDLAAKKYGMRPLIATDILNNILQFGE